MLKLKISDQRVHIHGQKMVAFSLEESEDEQPVLKVQKFNCKDSMLSGSFFVRILS